MEWALIINPKTIYFEEKMQMQQRIERDRILTGKEGVSAYVKVPSTIY